MHAMPALPYQALALGDRGRSPVTRKGVVVSLATRNLRSLGAEMMKVWQFAQQPCQSSAQRLRQTCTRRLSAALSLFALAAALAPTSALAACAPRVSPYSQLVSSTPGIVSYWRLGEASGSTVCDSVGSNPGSYRPGATLGVAGALAGDPDSAVALDGSNGSASVPATASLNVGDRFTIEAWVRRQRTGVTETIASKQNNSWLLEFNDANQLTLRRSTVADVVSSTSAITDTAWHYLAATKDGASVHLYIDGRDVTGPVLSPQTMADNTQPLEIGDSISSSYLQGTVDELALYNNALNASQIANHYSTATGGGSGTACAPRVSPYSQLVSSTPGIVSYWRLGEASGSTVCDSVGSNPGSYRPGATLGVAGALAGDPDSAVALDGSNGSASVPATASLNVGDRFTIEAWVRRQRTGVTETIASKQNNSWLLEFNDANQLTLRRSTVADVVSSTSAITDTAWHYLAATKDGASVHLYIDGRDVTGPVLSPQTMADNTQPLEIGDSISSSYLQGTVDELALYNNALNASQIANHYGTGSSGQAPAAPLNSSLPSVAGPARSGGTLNASTGTWSGLAPISFAFQWVRCTATGTGCVNVPGATTSTFVLGASDVGMTLRISVSASNSKGSSVAFSALTPVIAAAGDPVVVAVGDIACAPGDTSNGCQQKQTGILAAAQSPNAVLTLGDNQYNSGLLSEFRGAGAYAATWGQFAPIVHPSPGNHEYAQSSGAAGYFTYFGAAAKSGAYSFNLGTWHVVSLNSSCGSSGCSNSAMGQTTSAQTTWLQNDMAANPSSCTLAYWHHPRFSSSWNGDSPGVGPLWSALYNAHADLVLGGHDHLYERYALQSPAGTATTGGIREFIVGTGGEALEALGTREPNLQVFDSNDYGVLVLTLHATSYDWAFKRADGTIADSGHDTCHGRQSATPAAGTARDTGARRGDEAVGPIGPALSFDARPLRSSLATVARRGLRVAVRLSRGSDVTINVSTRRGRHLTRIASFREGDEEISRPYSVISLRLPVRALEAKRRVTLLLRLVARDAVGRYATVISSVALR